MEFTCGHPEELRERAGEIITALSDTRLVLFTGGLGAGKTTCIQALCEYLGVEDEVTSPTFSLINEYRGKEGLICYHIDLYRLETTEEAVQIGIEDYIHSGEWCFVEWPELIIPLIEEKYAEISIEITDDSQRKFRILEYPATDILS